MNKIVVGNAPSPNLVTAQSRIGSLSNTQHKVKKPCKKSTITLTSSLQPGGGKVKIENRKLEWNAQPKTKMVNENYTPGGGDKKVKRRDTGPIDAFSVCEL